MSVVLHHLAIIIFGTASLLCLNKPCACQVIFEVLLVTLVDRNAPIVKVMLYLPDTVSFFVPVKKASVAVPVTYRTV